MRPGKPRIHGRGGILLRLQAILIPLLLAAALSVSAGCGLLPGYSTDSGGSNSRGERTVPKSDVFNDQLTGGARDLDPATATGSGSLTVLGNVGEGLYRRNEDGNPVPGMAESVEVSGDRLHYKFTLRKDAKWSNGEPVTAQDFEYAWLRAMNPETAGDNANLLTDFIKGGAGYAAGDVGREGVGVKATGERTLEVTLKSPTAFFLDLTTLPVYLPLKERFVEKHEKQDEDFAKAPDSLLYNGPYEMTSYDPGRSVRLKKRRGYWDAANVNTKFINGQVVGSAGALGRYESGRLDVARLGPRRIPYHQAEANFERHTDFNTFSLYMNDDNSAMGNLELRKAVRTGFDRDSLVEAVLGDGSAPAYGYIPYGMSSGSGAPGGETFRTLTGDTVPDTGFREARRHWERGVEELGREPTLTILIGYGGTERKIGAFLKEQLEEHLGAKVKVEVVTPAALLERQSSGDYQILATHQKAQYDDPASYLAPRAEDSPMKGLRPIGSRYEKLVKGALSEPDSERRARMFAQAERVLVGKDALVAPIFYSGDSYLINPAVSGYDISPYGARVDYRYVEVKR